MRLQDGLNTFADVQDKIKERIRYMMSQLHDCEKGSYDNLAAELKYVSKATDFAELERKHYLGLIYSPKTFYGWLKDWGIVEGENDAPADQISSRLMNMLTIRQYGIDDEQTAADILDI